MKTQIIYDPNAGGYIKNGNRYFLMPAGMQVAGFIEFVNFILNKKIQITAIKTDTDMDKVLFEFELEKILYGCGIYPAPVKNTHLQVAPTARLAFKKSCELFSEFLSAAGRFFNFLKK